MDLAGIKYILLDIEGTVTPLTYVKDVLFGYARKNLEEFLDKYWDRNKELAKSVELIRLYSLENPQSPAVDGSKSTVKESVLWQMDRNVKDAGLKTLQALIWEEGYSSGQLKSGVYEDVYEYFKVWQAEQLKIGIYSSGSISAQKNLFDYASEGSLLKYISSFHDLTTAGSKLEATSYSKIAKSIGYEPGNILFLTDVYGEYIAAKDAGMKSIIVLRPGNQPLTSEERQNTPMISNFNQLKFEN